VSNLKRIGEPGEALPSPQYGSATGYGKRQKQVSEFLALDESVRWAEVSTDGCRSSNACFTSLKHAILRAGVEGDVHPEVRQKRVYLVRGPAPESDGRGNKEGKRAR